jgi:hypothetical protein
MYQRPIFITTMKSITYLEDRQSEALSGGKWRSYVKTKFASTNVSQSNYSSNIAVGLFGSANAQSIQGNAAFVSTYVF